MKWWATSGPRSTSCLARSPACLLIANANVANLMLARASVRGKEIALRAALGASRGRIIRQLLTESVLLAGLGGLLGLLIAQWGTEALVAAVPQNIPRVSAIQLDGAVLGFTLLLSLGTGIIFGLVPAWQASHVDLNTALKSGTRGAGGVEGKHRARNALVMTEVALALILLICASLLIQSFARLGRVQTGMRTERLFTARIGLPEAAYPQPENIIAFFDQLMPRLRAIPGVESVTTVWPLPLSGSNNVSSFDIEERPMPEGQQPDSPMRIVGSDYFKTMGIPVRQGRGFEETDQLKSLPVVVVNEQFAQKFFPGQNAVGKRINPGWAIGDEKSPMRTIVGVVGNVKHRTLDMEFTPEVYLSTSQIPMGGRVDRGAHECLQSRGHYFRGPFRAGRRRSQHSARPRPGFRGIPLARAGPAALQRHVAFDFCRHRLAADGDRNLRRDGVFRFAAHERDRHPHRARRGKVIHLSPRRWSGHDDRGDQSGRGTRRRLCRHPLVEQPSLRRRRVGSRSRSSPSSCSSPPSRFVAAWLPARRAMRVDPIIALRAE